VRRVKIKRSRLGQEKRKRKEREVIALLYVLDEQGYN
jgi:hypothetical protein